MPRRKETTSKSLAGHKVNKAEFARIIGRSTAWVDRLIEQGLPAEGRGQRGKAITIDTPTAIKWMVDSKAKKISGRPGADAPIGSDEMSWSEAERQLKIEKLELAKIERQEKIGMLVSGEEVSRLYAETLVAVRKSTDALAGRLANDLAAVDEPGEIRKIILNEARKSVDGAANEIETFIDSQEQIAAIEAAAIEDGVGVGRE